MKNRLYQKYQQEVVPTLQKEWGLKNPLAVPRVEKVVVSIGIGEMAHNKEILQKASDYLAQITGQKPKLCRAKKSIAGFKIRQGDPIGLMVTLRRRRMYDFLDKLFTIVLPRVRDFQGVSRTAFDGHGNYNLGLREQTVFPEIDYDKIDKVRGLQVTIVTNTDDDKKAERLLELLGLPFEKKKSKE